ncbi:hypothetical protein FDF50_08315 [Clostridium botulinum]|uniref:Phage protein Gp138 N-terminal domain-containing protein n=1 Tax=Clostridium botulinum TaxID=1491 RepID=A0A6G4HQ65_CLOBO|nr:Gp138 family membrane-puncturing spike protein [Clostridium botulinum]MBO0571850.1 hypothetical protein [Clostridium botulinum]NFJ61661.1 hypothetical protein [Clostridium botulinum]NFQ62488.1 hypothetical protein [Clostridium botulinum]NFR17710.1 hypothetical protein [Clostridium botulinum]NFU16769.1 hypothetical protein [Clostridium botulinum]
MKNRNLNEIIGSDTEMFRSMGDGWKNVLRVACPGIIQSFDSETQTVTVQLALREHITKPDFTKEWVNLPLLLDVPIVISRAGGYCLTMPIQQGDECLVIFADMCIDSWFTYGGIQNQIEKRRHDLSDGFAILGVWSQPQKIKNYSTDSCQLRTIDGTSSIEIKGNSINLVGDVKINGTDITPKP